MAFLRRPSEDHLSRSTRPNRVRPAIAEGHTQPPSTEPRSLAFIPRIQCNLTGYSVALAVTLVRGTIGAAPRQQITQSRQFPRDAVHFPVTAADTRATRGCRNLASPRGRPLGMSSAKPSGQNDPSLLSKKLPSSVTAAALPK